MHDKIFGSLWTKVPCCRKLQVCLQDSHHTHNVCMRGLAAIRVAHETEVQVHRIIWLCNFWNRRVFSTKTRKSRASVKMGCLEPGSAIPSGSQATDCQLRQGHAWNFQNSFVVSKDLCCKIWHTSGFSCLIAMISKLSNLRGRACQWRSARTWWSAVPQRVRIASPQKI